MKSLILAAATLLLITGEARERRGPPPACPEPTVECGKKKCPQPCAAPEKPVKRKVEKPANSKVEKALQPVCEKPCKPVCPKPCCPPVCFERGHETSECCLPSAIVEPANIELRCGWDLYTNLSFTYWNVMQDGMDLALPGQASSISPLATPIQMPATNKEVLYQDDKFSPGFKFGLGWTGAADGWNIGAEYTWVRGSTKTSSDAEDPDKTSINGVAVHPEGVWIPTSWFSGHFGDANATDSINSKWKYGIDIVDARISRPSYIGDNFVLEPTFGLRGLWIRQNMHIEANNLNAGLLNSSRVAHNKSHSWAVGPRAGFNGKWHLGAGLRFIGDATASLLYTNYDTAINVDPATSSQLPVRFRIRNFDALRPNLDLSLGLGWGAYFNCRRFHLDFAATYDFSVFWQQNMMRYTADLLADQFAHPAAAPSNLYLQGLTIKAEFEF